MIRNTLLFATLGLAGCSGAALQDTPSRAQNAGISLPPMKTFATPRPTAPVQSNGNISADFLDLHFQLESGRALPVFTRFETPITVRVTGTPPASLQPDLRRLLGRLQQEAGIDIRQIGQGTANITIQAVSRAEIRRTLPNTACFVVPNVSSLDEFRRERRRPKTSWSMLRNRTKLAIFLPYDASPQEVRDCLHEELAQAIGPLNDLYRLPDSVFNDDNVNSVLTGFDMLILRATYAPELRTGMSRAEVAARLPTILARLNPRGVGVPTRPIQPTPRSWKDAVQTTLGPGADLATRRAAATTATRIAQTQGWQDHRRAFGYYILGRMTQGSDPTLAQRQYDLALLYLSRLPGTDLHRAFVIAQTAEYAVAIGDGTGALRQIEPMLSVAAQAENAILLSTLMLLQVEALELTGQYDKARAVRLDSLGWARYGFGSDWVARAKLKDATALNPQTSRGG